MPALRRGAPKETDMLMLLDLLHAPKDSALASLAKVLTRIENLSHVLAWAPASAIGAGKQLWGVGSVTEDELWLVQLPRLKLSFIDWQHELAWI